jgi:ATP-dependent Clp protease adaptor protein ClpS
VSFWETDEDVLVDEDIETGSGEPAQLIVFNDDVNSFDWVIETFMAVLGYSSVQSEQLAIIIHTKGKATVKTGDKSELVPLCSALLDRGLSAEID